jgi:hypothetical protein
VAGIGAGLGLSLVAVRFLHAMLWGVRQTDPVTFTAASAILLLVPAGAASAVVRQGTSSAVADRARPSYSLEF